MSKEKQNKKKLQSRSSVSHTTGRKDHTSRLIQLKYRKTKSMLWKWHMLSMKSPLFLNSNWKFGCSVHTHITDTISETFGTPQLNNWYQPIFDVTVCHHFSACGATLTSLTGLIQSPNFPNNYPNGLGCVYVISVPDAYRVTLTFTNFDVENSTDCKYDYVEVLNCWCCWNYGCCYFLMRQYSYNSDDSPFSSNKQTHAHACFFSKMLWWWWWWWCSGCNDNGCVSMMFYAVRQDGENWHQMDVCYKQNKNYYLKCAKTIIHQLSHQQKACLWTWNR